MASHDEFIRARKVDGAKLGFYIHLTAYVVVNALLVGINLATSSGYLWFKWPLLGWGIGILVHACILFRVERWRHQTADDRKGIREINCREIVADSLPGA